MNNVPYDAGEDDAGLQPRMERVITEVMAFRDGSRLKVIVEAPAGMAGDRATVAYRAIHVLLMEIAEIEKEAK